MTGFDAAPEGVDADGVVAVAAGGVAAFGAMPERWAPAGVPRVALHGFDAAAPEKVAMALDAALGRVAQRAGAFAA